MQAGRSRIYKKFFKRVIDLLFAMFLLVLTFPIFIIVALLIKIDSAGPIIFVQKRTGLFGKDFNIYKFRTMSSDNNVLDFKKENQMTKVGRIIRSLSLDELPQLFNVVKGDMSFVGPRPWIIEYYKNMNQYQKNRVSVRPGITGLAQVNGRNSLSIHQKIDYDLIYVEKMSFIFDIKIGFDTIKAVFTKAGQEMEKSGIKDEIEALKKQRSYSFGHDVYDVVEGSFFKESALS